MLLSRHQNAGQIMKAATRSFENEAQFKYLKKAITNQNFIRKEIEMRLIGVMLATIEPKTFCFLDCCLN
jgi:hypothetical protein